MLTGIICTQGKSQANVSVKRTVLSNSCLCNGQELAFVLNCNPLQILNTTLAEI